MSLNQVEPKVEDLPKYFKDADGFCYTATPMLATQKKLTPWNGDVDAAGFAVVEKPAAEKPVAKAKTKPE